jgi:hypothetical protein
MENKNAFEENWNSAVTALGWDVREYTGSWEFVRLSPAGEDFSFCIQKRDASDADAMAQEVRDCANDLDFGSNAHKEMLLRLADALEGKTPADDDAGEDEEPEFTDEQLARNDELDNAMYQFLLTLLEKTEDEFEWDMYHIGEALDAVQEVMLDHGFDIHRPYIEYDGDKATIYDYERATSKEE